MRISIRTKAFLAIFTISAFALSLLPVQAATSGDGDGNNLDLSILQLGDIVMHRGGSLGKIIPGYWDHASMYVGYLYALDHETGTYHYDHYIVEAIADGVVYSSVSRILTDDEVAVLRVSGATATHKQKAVDFMKTYAGGAWESSWFSSKWVWGAKTEYDYNYLYGMDTYGSMYCSELVCKAYDWAMDGAPGAAYNYRYDNSDGNSNTIDADPGWSGWDYYWACAPSEIYESSRTYEVVHCY